MPHYDYRCLDCGHEWEDFHAVDETARDCPECESKSIKKRITTAPTVAGGVLTHAGDGKRASKAQLETKWAEETPKLRKKLVEKFGEKAVNALPSLRQDNES